ncbi:TraR/DksA C4-type zinc finger protein [Neobacillus sp. 179-C4.2 HS]|jgi:DnaK suppressor protein|uniref:TraR/DksA C4-type zinc finger protein n=1 Tax=Neobacillus driksii TaxID=3035913 RepID=A0ABV4YZ15_9BACI|nr:TraR/DksA C4-type zinc finger protein [Neobacillus sp. 179.-C4.2 HS]MDP5194533.1 TraR/DksA C4-type zinc finger protein [Neobacillus sp. 179.-C4.2 HS]
MLSKEELSYFKKKLLQLKEETIQMVEANEPLSFEDYGELTSYDNHFADTATQLEERERQRVLHDTANNLLEEVNEALERIKTGTYGVCVDTGKTIPYERLKALPYAKRTVDAQKELEKENVASLPEDHSFLTPEEDVRGDKRIQTVDELISVHGNSSS